MVEALILWRLLTGIACLMVAGVVVVLSIKAIRFRVAKRLRSIFESSAWRSPLFALVIELILAAGAVALSVGGYHNRTLANVLWVLVGLGILWAIWLFRREGHRPTAQTKRECLALSQQLHQLAADLSAKTVRPISPSGMDCLQERPKLNVRRRSKNPPNRSLILETKPGLVITGMEIRPWPCLTV